MPISEFDFEIEGPMPIRTTDDDDDFGILIPTGPMAGGPMPQFGGTNASDPF